MSTLDIILLALILFGAYNGFRKGFILEVLSVVAFILAIIGGFKLLHWGMDVLDDHFSINGHLLPYISFIIIFVGIIVLVNLLGKTLKKIVEMALLGPVDKIAGAIVSAIKWAFGLSIIIWLTDSFGVSFFNNWAEDSVIYSYLLPVAPVVVESISALLPFAQDLFESIRETLQGDSAT